MYQELNRQIPSNNNGYDRVEPAAQIPQSPDFDIIFGRLTEELQRFGSTNNRIESSLAKIKLFPPEQTTGMTDGKEPLDLVDHLNQLVNSLTSQNARLQRIENHINTII